MKAIVVDEHHQLNLRDVPAPVPGPFEALVKIKACGICSTTDNEIIRGTQPYHSIYPCLLGHEAIGEVTQVGDKVKTFHVGDLVTRPVAIWPGTSRDGLASGWGGFAEYGFVRDRAAMKAAGDASAESDYTALRQNVVPKGISVRDAVAAIALAETLSWSRHLPEVKGKQVCIAGTGIAGLSLILWIKLLGAKSIIVIGRREERLALAKSLGATSGVNAKSQDVATTVKEASSGGVDLFLEAVGEANQLHVACQSIRPGGTIAVYGVPPGGKYELNWSWLPPDVRFMQPPAEEHLGYGEVAKLILDNKLPVEKLMTHQWPLQQFAGAFEQVRGGAVVKGMLVMP